MKKSIFFVEDDEMLAHMYGLKFEQAGYKVTIANDAADCLNALESEKPDIFVIDILLPKMNGIKLIKEIRKKSGLVETPVIVLTNLYPAEIDMKDELRQSLGINEFFVKSHISPQKLVSTIADILKNDKKQKS